MTFVSGTPYEHMISFKSMNVSPRVLQIVLTLCHAATLIFALSVFANLKGTDDTDFNYQVRCMGRYLRKFEDVSMAKVRMAMSYHRRQHALQQTETIQRLVDSLPSTLKMSIATDMYGSFVELFEPFSQGPFSNKAWQEQFLSGFCTLMKPRHHVRGDMVVKINDFYEGMFFTISGELVQTSSVSAGSLCSIERSNLGAIRITTADAKTTRVQICAEHVGTECLFAPETPEWQLAKYSVLSVGMSELAIVTRSEFDMLLTQHFEWSSFIQFIRSNVGNGLISLSYLPFGIEELIIEDFWTSFHGRIEDTTSEDLGISCAYLLDHFLKELMVEGFTRFSDTTFSDLSQVFWGEKGNFKGFKGSAGNICPRDGMPGSSIVDALEYEFKGKATQFVSWCWNYTVETVASALKLWAEENHVDASQTFFWMCFFCNNQRKMLIQKDECSLTTTFCERLQKVGHMIILLNTYHKPYYTSRVWCIYETYVSNTGSISTDVALPEASRNEFYKRIKLGGFAEIAASLAAIDTEAAQASVEADALEIKSLIRNSIGFKAVNETVKCALTAWLGSAFGECLKMSSISDVTRHIFEIITYENSATSLRSSQTLASSCFHLSHWVRTAREHPELFKFMELDSSKPENSFSRIDVDDKLVVQIQDLEVYLQSIDKCNIGTFVAWLRDTHGDTISQSIKEQLQLELRSKLEDLDKQAQEGRDALSKLLPNQKLVVNV